MLSPDIPIRYHRQSTKPAKLKQGGTALKQVSFSITMLQKLRKEATFMYYFTMKNSQKLF